RCHLVAMFRAALFHGLESRADLHTLHGVDAHHSARQVGIEPLEHRLAPARRHALGDDRHARTNGIARLANPPDQILELWNALWIGAKKWIVVGALRVHGLKYDRTHLHKIPMNGDLQPLAQ